MIRPPSIVTFERCYLGAMALGLVAAAIGWRERVEMATIQMSQSGSALPGSFVTNMMVGTIVVGTAISLLLWYFVARRRSVVAKWIVTVFFGLGILGLLMQVAQGTMPAGVSAVITIVDYVLYAIAVWMLFKPDAKVWFGETREPGAEGLTDTFS